MIGGMEKRRVIINSELFAQKCGQKCSRNRIVRCDLYQLCVISASVLLLPFLSRSLSFYFLRRAGGDQPPEYRAVGCVRTRVRRSVGQAAAVLRMSGCYCCWMLSSQPRLRVRKQAADATAGDECSSSDDGKMRCYGRERRAPKSEKEETKEEKKLSREVEREAAVRGAICVNLCVV